MELCSDTEALAVSQHLKYIANTIYHRIVCIIE